MADIEFTPVMFRRNRSGEHKGEVTAIFPTLEVNRYGDVGSYAQVGQHGMATWRWVHEKTRPAAPEQYADLKRELEAAPYGYRLKVIKRRPRR